MEQQEAFNAQGCPNVLGNRAHINTEKHIVYHHYGLCIVLVDYNSQPMHMSSKEITQLMKKLRYTVPQY